MVGDTTSKQNLLSMSSHGLTEQSRRSSTTTVRESCKTQHKRDISHICDLAPMEQQEPPTQTLPAPLRPPGPCMFTCGRMSRSRELNMTWKQDELALG